MKKKQASPDGYWYMTCSLYSVRIDQGFMPLRLLIESRSTPQMR